MSEVRSTTDGFRAALTSGGHRQGTDGKWSPLALMDKLVAFARAAFGLGETKDAWTPAAGKKIRLKMVHVTASGATVVTVKLGNALVVEFDFGGAGSASIQLPDNGVVGAADEKVTLTSTTAVTVGGTFCGREE